MAKSTVWVCWRASRVISDVGRAAATVASTSSDADVPCSRAAVAISLIAANRSAMGISPVGTIIRASEKALAPELSVRVLTAIEARSCSTGSPSSMW